MAMKVGDLILCTWQPSIRGIVDGVAQPAERAIKGQCGIITEAGDPYRVAITFPGLCGYTHYLSPRAFEVLNEIW
jgi:hypothetical protein